MENDNLEPGLVLILIIVTAVVSAVIGFEVAMIKRVPESVFLMREWK